jgi:hypothetical protein
MIPDKWIQKIDINPYCGAVDDVDNIVASDCTIDCNGKIVGCTTFDIPDLISNKTPFSIRSGLMHFIAFKFKVLYRFDFDRIAVCVRTDKHYFGWIYWNILLKLYEFNKKLQYIVYDFLCHLNGSGFLPCGLLSTSWSRMFKLFWIAYQDNDVI